MNCQKYVSLQLADVDDELKYISIFIPIINFHSIFSFGNRNDAPQPLQQGDFVLSKVYSDGKTSKEYLAQVKILCCNVSLCCTMYTDTVFLSMARISKALACILDYVF